MTIESLIKTCIVTADQMQTIESGLFAAGMPVAALMEKVGQRLTERLICQYPLSEYLRVGVLVGPGHNGGDGFVVARELFYQGYQVQILQPLKQLKDLTQAHGNYAKHLDLLFCDSVTTFLDCDLIVDALFGFGLTQQISGELAQIVQHINASSVPVVSIDLPSGLHTNTGMVLGTAIAAQRTYCLGLWKRGLFCEPALPYIGQAELIEIGIRDSDVLEGMGEVETPQLILPSLARSCLPLKRPILVHKYTMGSLLLVCGSKRFPGAALLSALGASAMGVGMVYVAVPESLQLWIVAQMPHAVVIPCPETPSGAIAQLPDDLDWKHFDAIALGPGLTLDAAPVLERIWTIEVPLILDADALNVLSHLAVQQKLLQRPAPTVLTPHEGEFKRLFSERLSERLSESLQDGGDRISTLRQFATECNAILVLKGARTIIASAQGEVWINPDSTPALARGGSGDVLTGIMAGLLTQAHLIPQPLAKIVATACWLHAQAGCWAEQTNTQMGVDPMTLIQNLTPVLKAIHGPQLSHRVQASVCTSP